MVGLSVVLEPHHSNNASPSPSPSSASASAAAAAATAKTVVNKATAVKPPEPHPSSASSSRRSGYLPGGNGFLDACYLCRQKLLPDKDIYMYKGDKAFCSEDCRLKLMAMDGYDEDNNNFN